MIYLALTGKYSISICSVSFPHLRKGVIRDWRKIMEDFKIYNPSNHFKTEQLYTYPTGSYIEFFSVDNALKVRGPGRDILFINEANIIQKDTFRQLLLRTKKVIFMDYNPADEFHWIYDDVLPRKDCYFIKSTYKDNPYLPQSQVQEVENYKETDENYWRIYGLGERGHTEGVIYTHWQPIDQIPQGKVAYGLDFGFNVPSSLVKVTENQGSIYVEELIYESHITNPELIELIKQKIPARSTIYCDHENDRIKELNQAGFTAVQAHKNHKDGIDFLKSHKLFIHSQSYNLLKEIKSYKYEPKPRNEDKKDEPKKLNDHAMDAMRYAAVSFKVKRHTFMPQTMKSYTKKPGI